MYLYEDRKDFNASANALNLKPLHSRILKKKNQSIKEELEAKFQWMTDSKSKIKNKVWRTIPQGLRDNFIIHYKFIPLQTNWR